MTRIMPWRGPGSLLDMGVGGNGCRWDERYGLPDNRRHHPDAHPSGRAMLVISQIRWVHSVRPESCPGERGTVGRHGLCKPTGPAGKPADLTSPFNRPPYQHVSQLVSASVKHSRSQVVSSSKTYSNRAAKRTTHTTGGIISAVSRVAARAALSATLPPDGRSTWITASSVRQRERQDQSRHWHACDCSVRALPRIWCRSLKRLPTCVKGMRRRCEVRG